jgi:2-oxoisovalerate dehydrogenase E1 component
MFPGWRVFAPTNAFDYIGLFNAAMRCESPTLIIEHHELYGMKFHIPQGAPDHNVQPGRAVVAREGKCVTIVAYSFTVPQSLAAARTLEAEGIDAEVLDLRSLDAAGIDYRAIGASLGKTGALLFVEQAPACSSLGPRIAAECQRRFFDSFDGPPAFVAAPSVPLPVSRRLERACIPTVDDIVAAARKSAGRKQA